MMKKLKSLLAFLIFSASACAQSFILQQTDAQIQAGSLPTPVGRVRVVMNSDTGVLWSGVGTGSGTTFSEIKQSPGAVVRIAADGTTATHRPASLTAVANYTALRAALSAAVSGDIIVTDREATYSYDGTQLSLTARNNVAIRKFKCTRPIGVSYSRIIVFQDCIDCSLEIDFDGLAGIAYEQDWPFESANAISAVNENNPGGPTYVVEFNNSTRCVLRNSSIQQHAGDRVLVVGSNQSYPQFDTTYGIHIFSTCRDCMVVDSRFDYCGLSAISSNAPGTVVDNCIVRNTGWHGIRFGNVTANPGKVTLRNCTLIEDVFRPMGYRTTVNFNGQPRAVETALIQNCTFRHDYDWLDDLVAYSGATTYNDGDHVYFGSPVYVYERQGGSGSGVAPAGGKVDNANWKWLMEYASTWQVKFGNTDQVKVRDSRFESGKNGDVLGIRANIKIEDETDNVTIDNCYVSGCILGSSGISKNVDLAITGRSEINATSEAGFSINIHKLGSLIVEDSILNYEHRCINIGSEDLKTAYLSHNSQYVPCQVTQTESEIINGVDIGTAFAAIDFDSSNRIVDNTHESVTFNSTTDRVNSTATSFVDNLKVVFNKVAAATMPTGINDNQEYWVINKTANDFQVSLTKGGAAVNFTSNGSGTIYADGAAYRDGFIKVGTGHSKGDNADVNLLMSGSTGHKFYDATLTNRLAHPTVTAGGSLSFASAYGTQDITIRNKAWSGLGDTVDWTWSGSLWVPTAVKPKHITTGSGDGTPDVTFCTSCETPADGTTITDFDWSVPIPEGWILDVSIGSGDTIDAGTGTIDFGQFGTGPSDPWTPSGGGYMRLRYDGTTWIRLVHQ